jgi:hypothetical protein
MGWRRGTRWRLVVAPEMTDNNFAWINRRIFQRVESLAD